MTEQQIYDGVVMSGTTDFAFVVAVLRRHGAGWCVIGGMAVNAYVRPVYTADLDMVVVAAELAPVLADLRAADFRIKEFPYSIKAQRRADPAERASHMLLVQFSKAEEYQGFVERAVLRPLLGLDVPVAVPLDLAQGKLSAWGNPGAAGSQTLEGRKRFVALGRGVPGGLRHAAGGVAHAAGPAKAANSGCDHRWMG